jgi:hypothetical protein
MRPIWMMSGSARRGYGIWTWCCGAWSGSSTPPTRRRIAHRPFRAGTAGRRRGDLEGGVRRPVAAGAGHLGLRRPVRLVPPRQPSRCGAMSNPPSPGARPRRGRWDGTRRRRPARGPCMAAVPEETPFLPLRSLRPRGRTMGARALSRARPADHVGGQPRPACETFGWGTVVEHKSAGAPMRAEAQAGPH